jgi:hypothetical protein
MQQAVKVAPPYAIADPPLFDVVALTEGIRPIRVL